MKLRSSAADRRQPPRLRQDRSAAGRRTANRSAGPQHRLGATSGCGPLSGALPRDRRRRSPGNCATRRPSWATCSSAPAAPIFTTPAKACNKRKPGSGCSALGGYSRQFGGSSASVTPASRLYPGDMAVAMRVLGASVETVNADGTRRTIPLEWFPQAAGHYPARGKRAGPGRTHYGGDIAQARWRHADLPQGPRPGLPTRSRSSRWPR